MSISVYFELWLLRLSGFWPNWSVCDECGRLFSEGEGANVRANFHLICSGCQPSAGTRSISASGLSFAMESRRMSPVQFADFTDTQPKELRRLSIILKQLISQAIGREVTGETSLALSD
ncbi:MAG: DNA repair protein RecO C-terminal domain-containing protein [Pyrinomonadaceae bacterium]